jgi:hypothetical protein
MPRKTKHPNIILALSSAALATAGDVSETIVRQAGTLGPIYSMGAKRRLLVSDCEQWIRTHWAKNKARKPRKSKPAGTVTG